MKRNQQDHLWAITCYFNPLRYRRRLKNYHVFRKHLAAPLVTVELAFDGAAFELSRDDAEVLIQVSGGDIMWQKERLLNIAVQNLPSACTKVAWIDCDVVFGNDSWPERASIALEQYALLHLFDERHDLPHLAGPEQFASWNAPPTSRSVVSKRIRGCADAQDYMLANAPKVRNSTAGLAWASPRWLLEEHGLYDACILGSGDRSILCAAIGEYQYATQALRMGAVRQEHYLEWARPYYAAVQGRVGYIRGRALHLWHGDAGLRKYQERHNGMRPFGFDPNEDIAIGNDGPWRWDSNKPHLHRYVRDYFASRNEDGC